MEALDGVQFGHQVRRVWLGDKNREVGQMEVDEWRPCRSLVLDEDLVTSLGKGLC